MFVQLFVAATLMATGLILFGHFERHTAIWRRFAKLIVVCGVTALLYRFVGPVWGWIWIFGSFGLGVSVHVWLMQRHGINWLTAEPLDKYYALRGWSK
jgi:hypothetical protein